MTTGAISSRVSPCVHTMWSGVDRHDGRMDRSCPADGGRWTTPTKAPTLRADPLELPIL